MQPRLRHVGNSRTPLVIVDHFSGRVGELIDIAAELMPFPVPQPNNYYPGVRRVIEPSDPDADSYVEDLLNAASPFIAGAFDIERFDLVEASFSMVTADPKGLQPVQRQPHFDSADPGHLAVLHYINVPADSGTGFFRQRSTGIEVVTDDNCHSFVAAAESAQPGQGYIAGSTPAYELIEEVRAVADRLIIYPGQLLHSGIIPDTMNFSSDPRSGRLTCNIFVRAS